MKLKYTLDSVSEEGDPEVETVYLLEEGEEASFEMKTVLELGVRSGVDTIEGVEGGVPDGEVQADAAETVVLLLLLPDDPPPVSASVLLTASLSSFSSPRKSSAGSPSTSASPLLPYSSISMI
jgi:hypothetical protein